MRGASGGLVPAIRYAEVFPECRRIPVGRPYVGKWLIYLVSQECMTPEAGRGLAVLAVLIVIQHAIIDTSTSDKLFAV